MWKFRLIIQPKPDRTPNAAREIGRWCTRPLNAATALGWRFLILSTLMCTNFDKMDQMVSLARLNGCNLRVNAYQAVKTDAFRLSYPQFWEGYRRLFSTGLVVACSEPVVRAVMGLPDVQSPCGRRSLRINPRGQVIPCVYWPVVPSDGPTIADLPRLKEQILSLESFRLARSEPAGLSDCACRGGCASRRSLNRNLDAHDDFCPWAKGDPIHLEWKPAPARDLMRIGNVCTTIVV